MAYKSTNLSVLAYANGFTLWHYATNDSASEVESNGYFNKAADMLRAGDMVFSNIDVDGTPGAGVLVVKSTVGGAVDVSNLTPLGTTG